VAINALTLVRAMSTANKEANSTEARREVVGGFTVMEAFLLVMGTGFSEAFRPVYFAVFRPAAPATLRDEL
jgi:hypothetical protein